MQGTIAKTSETALELILRSCGRTGIRFGERMLEQGVLVQIPGTALEIYKAMHASVIRFIDANVDGAVVVIDCQSAFRVSLAAQHLKDQDPVTSAKSHTRTLDRISIYRPTTLLQLAYVLQKVKHSIQLNTLVVFSGVYAAFRYGREVAVEKTPSMHLIQNLVKEIVTSTGCYALALEVDYRTPNEYTI